MRTLSLLGLLLATGVASAQAPVPIPAAPAPTAIDRAAIDKKAMKVAYDAVKSGAEMFNDGNLEGCLRLYEGTLLALEPFLDHKPELVKLIDEKMTKARGLAKLGDKAFVLREALDAVMNAGMPAPTPKKVETAPMPKEEATPKK